MELKAHREGDKFPPLSLLATIAMTIGCPIVVAIACRWQPWLADLVVAIVCRWQPSQLKKTATAPEKCITIAPVLFGNSCSLKWGNQRNFIFYPNTALFG